MNRLIERLEAYLSKNTTKDSYHWHGRSIIMPSGSGKSYFVEKQSKMEFLRQYQNYAMVQLRLQKDIGPNLFHLLNTWLSSSSMHANPIPLSQHTAAAIESQAERLNAQHTM
mgnify:CR=1 FL=1